MDKHATLLCEVTLPSTHPMGAIYFLAKYARRCWIVTLVGAIIIGSIFNLGATTFGIIESCGKPRLYDGQQ